ncbi:MAG: hypothetical protein ACE5E6_09100, partial [Phycisphaerae bacterium]
SCSEDSDCAASQICNESAPGTGGSCGILPFNDGDALYEALAQFAPAPPAFAPPPPNGLLVVTFTFEAIAPAGAGTQISIPASAGEFTQTVVLDGFTPGLIVTGALGPPITVTITPGAGACGDGVCDCNENCETCPDDCVCLPTEVCEVPSLCQPQVPICAAFCGNGVCELLANCEDCLTCPDDCGCGPDEQCTDPPGDDPPFCETFCGNGVCEINESCINCEADCGCLPTEECVAGTCQTFCGNGICDGDENCETCAEDCPCDAGEACIDGVCQLFCGGDEECDDGVACTVDVCEPGGTCSNTPVDGLCANGVFCDGAETCDPVTGCQPGTPPTCDDGVDCTEDACPFPPGSDTCEHTIIEGFCDNGVFCDGVEVCNLSAGCQPGANPCPGQGCDEEGMSCVPLGACCTPTTCVDNSTELVCTTIGGTFFPGQECASGVCPLCGDGTCDANEDCETCVDDCACDPVLEQCVAGVCETFCGNGVCEPDEDPTSCPGDCVECQDNSECADGIACTVDICTAANVCDHVADDGACDNGLFCDGAETCSVVAGCETGTAPCAPEEVCDEVDDTCVPPATGACCVVDQCVDDITEDACNGLGGSFSEGLACGDIACGPGCGDGVCEGTENCLNCVPDCGCTFPEACFGGLCQTFCGNGICEPNETPATCPGDCGGPGGCSSDQDCVDDLECTTDVCDITGKCLHFPNDGTCDNGVFCDGAESCDPIKGCMPGEPPCPPNIPCNEAKGACIPEVSGACCVVGGEVCVDGADVTQPVCEDILDGFFHPNTNCESQVCEAIIVGSDPPDMAIDARQPTAPDGSNPDGWRFITLEFNNPLPNPLPNDFFLIEMGGDGVPPEIASVSLVGFTTVLMELAAPIEPGAWTIIIHNESLTFTRIGYLPGDVNGNAHSAANDVLTLIDHLNGAQPLPVWSADIDRSDMVTASDILRVIDLLNGAGVYDEWNGATLPN